MNAEDLCLLQRKVSPLHECAYRGFEGLVQQLIKAGASINAMDKVCANSQTRDVMHH